jgi:serine/threonine-protein kinase
MPAPSEEQSRQIDLICSRFEAAWKAGRSPRLEEFVADVGEEILRELFRGLLESERDFRQEKGDPLTAGEAAMRFGKLGGWVKDVLEEVQLPDGGDAETAPVAAHSPRRRFQPGEAVANGRYRIVALLGKGGMGEVYRADDVKLGQPVALKFLPESRASDPAWVAQLHREVSLAQKVSHPAVCRVHDLGEHDGQPFLSMEFVDGENLAALRQRVGGLLPEKVVACAAQLCDGLAALHEQGLLHRDLKPANVLLDRQGRFHLVDFGLAASADQIRDDDRLAGTLAYLAPEQLTGRNVSVRSDLFSLGLVLYELTTGRRPFPGVTPAELMRQHKDSVPKPPSELVPAIDPALERAILRCLKLDEKDRPASALELKRALPPLSPRETRQAEDAGLLSGRWALGLLAVSLALLALHAGLAERLMLWHQAPLEKSPQKLAAEARALLDHLGYEAHRENSASAMAWDLDHVEAVRKRPGPDRWSGGPALYFWYRESPEPFQPFYRLTPADPPLSSGMTCVLLDTQGRLLELRAVSDEQHPGLPVIWDEAIKGLFEAAKIDPHSLKETTPEWTPPTYADKRRAWAGDLAGESVRVEAAACGGRVVWFAVGADDRFHNRFVSRSHVRLGDEMSDWGTALVVLEVLGGAILAWRNLARGWADVRGAVRVGLLFVFCHLIGWFALSPLPGTTSALRSTFIVGLGAVTYWLLLLVIGYLALEPYFRRRWPRRLSAWNRLCSGEFGDPLVGRDVLYGVAAGLALNLLVKLLPLTDSCRGIPSWHLEWFTGIRPAGPDAGLGRLFTVLGAAASSAFFVSLLFLLLMQFLRREWLVIVVMSALFVISAVKGYLGTYEGSAVLWCGAALVSVAVALVVRLGVLSFLVASFTGTIVSIMPLTLRPQEWYALTNWVTIAVVAALAVYGALVATGRNPWLSEES